MGKAVYISNARASYPHLLQPHAAVAGGNPRYGINLIVPKAHPVWQEIGANIDAVVAEAAATGAPADMKRPEFEESTDEPGSFVIRAYGHNNPPGLVFPDGRVASNDIERGQVNQMIQPGYYINAVITFYHYSRPAHGVAVGLEGVQFVRQGEPLANRPDLTSMFKPVEGAPPAVAPGVVPQPAQQPFQPTVVPTEPAGGNPWD